MKVLTVAFGGVCGAFVGFVFGALGAICLGMWSKWAHPNDPSAGSVAVIVIGTAPSGAMLGAVLGGLLIAKRPGLFLVTVLPIAILFLSLQITLSVLRSHDVPRTYVLSVSGTQGEEFIGEVRVDGKLHKLRGELPAKFEYLALEVEFAFALPNAKEDETISFEIVVDGETKWGRIEKSEKRVAAKCKSFGYSESFGGTSYRGDCDLLPEHPPASQN